MIKNMKRFSKRNIAVAALSILIFIMTLFVLTKTTTTLKCPENFPETDAGDEERLAAMNKWTNDFYDSHPGSTLSQWAEARHQFYIANNCTKSLEKYEQAKAGKADPADMEQINNGIQEAINNNP
jgi:hypothetical protein